MTSFLLDTHVALWWAADEPTMSARARTTIADPRAEVWFSVASAWELAIKVRSGKLTVDVRRLVSQLVVGEIGLLGIGLDDAINAGELAWSHRDPFDRMIVAQAERLDLHVVTRDAAIIEHLSESRTVAA